jgi:hypothetical protein
VLRLERGNQRPDGVGDPEPPERLGRAVDLGVVGAGEPRHQRRQRLVRADHQQPFHRREPGLAVGMVAGGADQRGDGVGRADVREGLEVGPPDREHRLRGEGRRHRGHRQGIGDLADLLGCPIGGGGLLEPLPQPHELAVPFLGGGRGRLVPLDEFHLLGRAPITAVAEQPQGGHPLGLGGGRVVRPGRRDARRHLDRDRDQHDRSPARPAAAGREGSLAKA